jgi:hypothetical protein
MAAGTRPASDAVDKFDASRHHLHCCHQCMSKDNQRQRALGLLAMQTTDLMPMVITFTAANSACEGRAMAAGTRPAGEAEGRFYASRYHLHRRHQCMCDGRAKAASTRPAGNEDNRLDASCHHLLATLTLSCALRGRRGSVHPCKNGHRHGCRSSELQSVQVASYCV